jgi:hypothetical protein
MMTMSDNGTLAWLSTGTLVSRRNSRESEREKMACGLYFMFNVPDSFAIFVQK